MNYRMYPVPKGTRQTTCKGRDCHAPIYWIEIQRTGRKTGITRMPIDCAALPECSEPDSLSAGRGINHFEVCPNADDF
jgi:hypothetical protein